MESLEQCASEVEERFRVQGEEGCIEGGKYFGRE